MASIGDRLEEARKRQGISIREAAESTKIRGDFLLSFENNKFDIDLPEVYQVGFLRLYSRYLKLDADKVLADYRALLLSQQKSGSRRQDARENYGRLDIPESHPTLGSREAEPPGERARRAHDSGGPADPVQVGRSELAFFWKAGLILLGCVAVISLLVLLVQSLTSPASTGEPANPPVAAAEASGIITLIARDDVPNVLVRQVADREVLHSGPMRAGQRLALSREGIVRVASTNVESITVEIDGRRFSFGRNGPGQRDFGADGPVR